MYAEYTASQVIREAVVQLEECVDQAATLTDAQSVHVQILDLQERLTRLAGRSARHVAFVQSRISPEAPARHRDLTPAMDQQRCVCGVRFPRHFDGWDGNRLDCAEAVTQARATMTRLPLPESWRPLSTGPTPLPPLRRQWVENCTYCAQYQPTEMFPPHDAARLCESGKRDHCSCDRCF